MGTARRVDPERDLLQKPEETEESADEQLVRDGVKVSFYISKAQSQALDLLSVNLKHSETGYRSKSELIREAIDVVLRKYGRK